MRWLFSLNANYLTLLSKFESSSMLPFFLCPIYIGNPNDRFSRNAALKFTTLTVLHCLGTGIGGTDQTAGMHSGIEKQICYLSFEQCNNFFIYIVSLTN